MTGGTLLGGICATHVPDEYQWAPQEHPATQSRLCNVTVNLESEDVAAVIFAFTDCFL